MHSEREHKKSVVSFSKNEQILTKFGSVTVEVLLKCMTEYKAKKSMTYY